MPDSNKMMKYLLADNVVVVDLLCDTRELTVERSDSGTEQILKGFIEQLRNTTEC